MAPGSCAGVPSPIVSTPESEPLKRVLAPAAAPELALASGRWVKWIGGASNQDLAAIEDLAAIYSLAGVHCLDVAADAAVVAAARRGMAWAEDRGAARPWLMVSLSDGEDPHFRKAWFDPSACPPDCPRPCSRVCPAEAIAAAPDLQCGSAPLMTGVVEERCYGCGRCLPACPLGLIAERSQVLAAGEVAPLLAELRPDALELHTRPGRLAAFAARLEQVRSADVALHRLAVSCGLEPATGEQAAPVTPAQLAAELWQRHRLLRQAGYRPIWQLDGRPMRGDVGAGTAHAAVRLLERLAPLAPPGPLQLAGGTNASSLGLVERLGARIGRPRAGVAGIAFGSVARSLLQPLLQEAQQRGVSLREEPVLLGQARELAGALVEPWLAAVRR